MARNKSPSDFKSFLKIRQSKGLETQKDFATEEPVQDSPSTERGRKLAIRNRSILTAPVISATKYNQLVKQLNLGERVKRIDRHSMRRTEVNNFYGAVTKKILDFNDSGGQKKVCRFELMFHIPFEAYDWQNFSDPWLVHPDDLEVVQIGFLQVALASLGVFNLDTNKFILSARWGDLRGDPIDVANLDGFVQFMQAERQAMSELFGKDLFITSPASQVWSLLNMIGLRTKPVSISKGDGASYELDPKCYFWLEAIVRRRARLMGYG